MPRFAQPLLRLFLCAALLGGGGQALHAQKHATGSAPPTAPPLPIAPPRTPVVPAPQPHTSGQPSGSATPSAASQAVSGLRQPAAATPASHTPVATGPIAAISTGLGAIVFAPANVETPAPQSLLRQLSSDDERTRLGALSVLGAPGQYLTHGHIPQAHSMQLDLLPLGSSDELDALLTVELDQHVVSAILVPDGLSWRRIATLSFASAFSAGATTPSTFLRPLRSWLQPGRYRAVYHATVNNPNGDFIENEADVRILNGKPVVVLSFVSSARQCDLTGQLRPPHQTCEVLQRWLEPDLTDPSHRFTLITGVGHSPAHEAADPLLQSRNYRVSRLRSFSCQPFAFADNGSHLEPLANSAPCAPHPDHATSPDHTPQPPTHDTPPVPDHQSPGTDH